MPVQSEQQMSSPAPPPRFGTEPQSLEEYVRNIYHSLLEFESETRKRMDTQAVTTEKNFAKLEQQLAAHSAAISRFDTFQSTVRGIFIGVAAIVVPTVTAILGGVGVWAITS